MASYQDLDTRLKVVEDKLDYIMRHMQMQVKQKSAIIGGTDKVVSGSLLDFYRAAKAAGV